MVNSLRTEPEGLSACASVMRETLRGTVFATMPSSQARAPGPSTRYFAKLLSSISPTRSRMVRTSLPTCANQFERR